MLTYSTKFRALYLGLIILLLLLCARAPAATIEFYRNGVSKTVKVDTTTPANTAALPTLQFNALGQQVDLALESTLQSVLADTSSIDTKLPAQGQALMAASVPVAIASNQSAIPVTQSGTWNINNISGTISLPTGAATDASVQAVDTQIETSVGLPADSYETDETNSASLIAFVKGLVFIFKYMVDNQLSNIDTTLLDVDSVLNSIDSRIPSSLGQKTGANSLAVVMASDYVPASPSVPAAVTVKQAAISVGTTAVRLTTDASAPSSTRRRLNFMLDPSSTATCYYGSSSVTTTSTTRGVIFFPGATQEWVDDANDYYAICTVASQTIYVTEAE